MEKKEKPHPLWQRATDKDPNSTKVYVKDSINPKADWGAKVRKAKRDMKKRGF